MNTQTITITENSSTPLQFPLKSNQFTLATALSKLEEFAIILENYGKDENSLKDRASEKLFKWGVLFLNELNENNYEVEEKRILFYQEKLIKRLRDPFTWAILENPLIIQTKKGPLVLEEASFQRYNALRVHFGKKEITATPHPLANQLLSLIGSTTTPPKITPPQNSITLPIKPSKKELKQFKKNIKLVAVEREQKKREKELNKLNSILNIEIRENKKKLDESTLRFKEFVIKEKEETLKHLEEVVKESEKKSEMQTMIINDLNKDVSELKEAVEELDRKTMQQESHISQLRSQVAYERQRVNNMPRGGGGGCAIL